MIDKQNKQLYFSLALGTTGMVLIGLGIMRYFTLTDDAIGFGLSLLGFIIANNYLLYIEKKAGINSKTVRIQSITGTVILAGTSYLFFI